MNRKRVLLMYISNVSGHRCASLAIEQALREVDRDLQINSIDAFNYTNPHLEWLINRLYMFVIRCAPGVWNYLYDNENVLKRVKRTRTLFHKWNDKKIQELLSRLKPDIVICTQAFPCGMIADYKKRYRLDIPLVGVLTDYAPHSYWLNDAVDVYVVPAEKIKRRLIQKGISAQRLQVFGIPIDAKFRRKGQNKDMLCKLGLSAELPVILIMGGGQGLGPMKGIVNVLDQLKHPAQLVVVCGTNKKLYQWLVRRKDKFVKPIAFVGYTKRVDELMAISTFVVTKPGGLSSSEALSKALPILIVNPLPGQERLNSQFLLENGLAIQVNSFHELQFLAEELLRDNSRLQSLREKAAAFARPDAALKIAKFILQTISNRKDHY